MIDVKKALSQRCYIIFDSTEQLLQFLTDNNLTPYISVNEGETVISVHLDGDILTIPKIIDTSIPTYHHSQLTYTDDGE